jgi:hypothetical protein
VAEQELIELLRLLDVRQVGRGGNLDEPRTGYPVFHALAMRQREASVLIADDDEGRG